MTPDFGSPQKDETGRFWVAFAWREIHAPGALPHPATGRRRLGRGVAVSPPGRRGAWTAGSLAGFRQSAWGSFRPHTSARAMRQLPRTLPLGLCAVRNIPSVHLLFNAALRQSQNPRGFHRPNVVRHGDGLAGADDHGTIRLPDRHRRNEKRRQVKGGCALSLAGIPRL